MKKLLVSMLCLIGICLTFISCNNIDTFEINFIVDGNQYNIVECESEKTITFPDAPTKEGYVFEGWYLDDNIWKKPFTNELLLDTPIASDLSVYAKWGCEHISSGPATATQDEVCTVCGYVITKAVGISFKTLTVNGNDVYGKVSNDTNYYSFIDEISALGGAKYIVSTDISGTEVLPNKTMELSIGNNTVYITEYINEEPTNIYVVVIRRKPTYTVTFNSNGGNLVKPIIVAEDTIITPPQTTYVGYIFDGWNYDFSTPITSDTTIWAKWIKCEHLDAKHGETCDTCDLELKCIDVDKNNKCDNCGEKMSAKCPHEDVDEDGKCDKCGKSMSIITEVIEYPWADDDPVQLLFQMTHASNSQTLSSMCQRYLAGEDPNTIEKIDTMVADRNAMAAIKTNINVRYQYYDDADEYGLGKTIEKMLTDVKSGSTKIPDVYCNFAYDLVGASLKGTFANLKSHNYNHQGANYFEFLKDGWVQECDEDGYSVGYMYEYMQSTTLNEDKMYILASDYFVDLVRAFYVVPVHIGLLEANGAEITGDLDDCSYGI